MKRLNIIFWLSTAFLALLFTAYFIHFSTGIPKADDFPMMFIFLDKWEHSKLFYDKYLLLTEQFVDHRMLAMKLTVLAVKAISGKMNINAVNTVGLVIWFGTLYIIYKAFSHTRLPLIAFLPVLLLTLHPGYGYEGILWAATWMAFPWAIFLCLVSFYLLVFYQSRAALIVAWLFAFFALFSHGNGITSFLIGFLILIAQRKWKISGIWLGVSFLGLILFFFNYTSGGTSAHSPLDNLISRPLYVLSSMGAFTGASIYFPDYELTDITAKNVTAIIFGLFLCLVVVACCLYILSKLWSKKYSADAISPTQKLLLFCSAVGIFVVITAAMISCVRTDSEILRGFAARYHFYSALLISVVYLMGVSLVPELTNNARFQVVSVSLCLIYCSAQYWFQTADLANNARMYKAGLYNSKKNNMWVVYKDSRIWERGLDFYSKTSLWPNGSSNYQFPTENLFSKDAGLSVVEELKTYSAENLVEVDNQENDFYVHIRGPLFQISMLGKINSGSYVNLVSENKSFLYPLYQDRSGLRQFLKNQIYYKPEANVFLKKKWFPPGVYKLYVYVVNNGKRVLIDTHKQIKIKQYPYEV